jgi:hypothetical protein
LHLPMVQCMINSLTHTHTHTLSLSDTLWHIDRAWIDSYGNDD